MGIENANVQVPSEGDNETIKYGVEKAKKHAELFKDEIRAEEMMTNEQLAATIRRQADYTKGFMHGLEIENLKETEPIREKFLPINEKALSFINEHLTKPSGGCFCCGVFDNYWGSLGFFYDDQREFLSEQLEWPDLDEDDRREAQGRLDAWNFIDDLQRLINSEISETYKINEDILPLAKLAGILSSGVCLTPEELLLKVENELIEKLALKIVA